MGGQTRVSAAAGTRPRRNLVADPCEEGAVRRGERSPVHALDLEGLKAERRGHRRAQALGEPPSLVGPVDVDVV